MRYLRHSSRAVLAVVLGVTSIGVVGCGASGTGGPPGSGGSTASSGGSSGTGSGGMSASSGGSSGTGSGGSVGASGGTTGTTGSGGTAAGSGGSSSSGSGGASTASGGTQGGAAGRGGLGGRNGGGAAGRGVVGTGSGGAGGGTTSTTGSGGAGGPATMSAGCGKAPPASMRYTIDVGGTSREYILSVPTNYDQNHAYKLIFAWHPLGGSAMQTAGTGNSGYYGLKGSSNNEAILVSPEGTAFNGGTSLGWGNTGGADINFLKAMLEKFKSEMCIDEGRIFSTGFSFGGMFSNAVACAGLARAVAPMAGNSQVSGCTSGTTPVAYMGFHGTNDTVVDISGGRTARDTIAKRNGCTTSSTPMTPSWCDGLAASNQPCMCVTYSGCMAGYPVIWCEYNAGHQPAPNSATTLWSFFSQF